MTKHKIIDVLKYWYIEEYLLPQTLEVAEKLNNEYQQSFTGTLEYIISRIENLSNDSKHNQADSDYVWEFSIYGLIYKIEDIKTTLLSTLKVNDDFEERVQQGNAASYVLSFNSKLQFKIDGVQISTAPWAIKDIVKNKKLTHLDYTDFQSLEDNIKKTLNENATLDEYNFINFTLRVDDWLKKLLGAYLIKSDNYFQVIAKRKMRKNLESEQSDIDLLNSFYIEDLNKTINYVNDGGKNKLLDIYLEMDTIPNRKDIRKDLAYVYNMLSPNMLPNACWATKDDYPLVYSQQFAINSIKARLSDNGGIYSVNGPPGTGKTTMLRDLIASVVTDRATELAKLKNPEDIFTRAKAYKAWKNGDDQQYYRKLKKEFLGHEIVVASSNNGAVENITMEIPSLKSVDEKWLNEINYFSNIGSGLIDDNAWGSGAACLGNSSNKSNFISKFWNGSKDKNNIQLDGFATYFQKIINNNDDNSIEKKLKAWKNAKQEFLEAVQKVEQLKKEKTSIKERPSRVAKKLTDLKYLYNEINNKVHKVKKDIEELENKVNQVVKTINELNQQINTLNSIITNKAKNYESLKNKIDIIKNDINEWYIRKPSIIDIIFSLGKSWKKWNAKKDILENTEEELVESFNVANRDIQEDKSKIANGQLKVETYKKEQNNLKAQIQILVNKLNNFNTELEKTAHQYKVQENEHTKAINLLYKQEQRYENESSREKASPWTHDKDFQRARTIVFIKALNLHKALIDSNAREIRLNLFRMMEILGNKVNKGLKHEEAIQHIWATLFLCVPVVSTTFASFGRLFSQLWDNKIGWLLIDEAGQASTKAAVGAIMRSQRAVVVGDPLQLEPIIGLPGSIQEILHKEINAHNMAFSGHTSVQKRADFTEIHGTYLESHEGEDIWVGSPLRVHRRCHSPMFEISNRTTYKGLMVQGKGPDDCCTLQKSTWFNVHSTTNNGHWIKEEGAKAIEIVEYLLYQGVDKNDIYLISPFRDVVIGLKNIFRKNKLIDVKTRVGTIHTVQGKESKAVVLVLGSNPENNGARLWASSKPNLLNVATTRAKDRLYIIGDKSKWKDKQYFKDAEELLC